MSVNKLGILAFSTFLIVALALSAPAQSTAPHQDQTTGKQATSQKATTEKGTASKDDIMSAQQALKDKGMYNGAVDGAMNADTQKALRDFQQKNNLKMTGTLDKETKTALGISHEHKATRATPDSKSGSSTTKKKDTNRAPSEKPSAVMSEPSDVKAVQQSLTNLEFNPGDVNGIMTAQTRQAIREFQWLNSLPVTGNIDAQTKQAIDSWQQPQPGSIPSYQTKPRAALEGPGAARFALLLVRQDSDKDKSLKHSKEASERIAKSADVLQDLTATKDKKVPNELLERAEAIAVIPNMIKGAFGIGGRYGKGVVSQRAENGRWSAPSFIEIGGGSFGAQLGVSSTDLVLVFTDRKALGLLEGGKDLKLGVDAGVTAGPIGRSAEAGVNANLETAIYAYSRSKGLFAGIALDGAVLKIDKDMNEKVYGPTVNAENVLGGKTAVNATVRPFVDTLERVVPKKRLSQK